MASLLLSTTRAQGYRFLGDPWSRSPELIRATIRDAVGAEAALIFAEPVQSADGSTTDWYGEGQGPVLSLSELAGAEREAVQGRLAAHVAAIRDHAGRLQDSAAADDRRLAAALLAALEIPSEAAIRIVQRDGQAVPYLTQWASVALEGGPGSGILSAMVARPKPPEPLAAPAGVAGPPEGNAAAGGRAGWWRWLYWLGWALLALVIALILWLLVPACGVHGLRFWSHCPAPAARIAPAGPDAALLQEIDRLEAELHAQDRACLPEQHAEAAPEVMAPPQARPQPPPAPAPSPAPEASAKAAPAPKSDVDRRLEQAGANKGDLEFILIWNDISDMDLHVTPPGCREINFERKSSCGGTLDVDRNAAKRNVVPVRNPVEHVVFPQNAPTGTYTVRVHFYNSRALPGPRPFQLIVRQKGKPDRSFRGSVHLRNRLWTQTISVGANG